MSQMPRNRGIGGIGRRRLGAPQPTRVRNSNFIGTPGEVLDARNLQTAFGASTVAANQVIGLANAEMKERLSAIRGDAKEAVSETLPGVVANIRSGDLAIPDGQTVEDYVDAFIEGAADNQPDEWREHFTSLVKPRLIAEFTSQQAGKRDQARQETIQLIASSVAGATDASAFASAVQQMMDVDPNLSESRARALVGQQALSYAVETMDESALDAAASAVGNMMPADVARARRAIESRARTEQSRREREAFDQAANKVAEYLNQDQPVFDVAIATIEDANISESDKLRLRNQVESARAGAALDEVYGLINRNDYDGARSLVQQLTETGTIDNQQASRLGDVVEREREGAIGVRQAAHQTDLLRRVFLGRISPSELNSTLERGVQLPPDDPQYIHPDAARRMRGLIESRSSTNQQMMDVRRKLSFVDSGQFGGPLLTSDHGDELHQAFVERGHIDENGVIANPQAVSQIILETGVLPNPTEKLIQAALQRNDARFGPAYQVVRDLYLADSSAYEELRSSAGDSRVGRIMDGIANQVEAGVMQADEHTRTSVLQDQQDDTPITEQMISDIIKKHGRGGDMEGLIETVLNQERNRMPHAEQGTILFGPTFDQTVGVNQALRERIATTMRDNAGALGQKQLVEKATSDARRWVRGNVDFIRWGGRITPQLIDTPNGKMPPEYRWRLSDYEKQAKDALANVLSGEELDSIVSAMPGSAIINGELRFFYTFLNDSGDVIARNGNPVRWFPGLELSEQTKAINTLMEKEKNFENPRRGPDFGNAGFQMGFM